MKTLQYQDSQVASGSHLYELLTSNDPDAKMKAAKHYKELNADFMKNWKGFEHLLNFKLGNQPLQGST